MHFKLIGTNLFTGAKLRIKIKNILFSLQHLGMLISNFDIFFFFFFFACWLLNMTNFRKSRGFAKGTSIFRGVSRYHNSPSLSLSLSLSLTAILWNRNSDNKKWQAKLGKGKGVKGLYIGTFGKSYYY